MTILIVFAGRAMADEGMWLLPLLEKMNSKALKEAGCELSPKEILSVKDAIVQFGSGCTGEIVSDKGLLLTNHHCGYSNIQKLSSVEHDYLNDGYWAMNHSEELPCEGLTVKFLESMTDVTSIISKAEKKARNTTAYKLFQRESEVEEAVAKAMHDLVQEAERQNPDCAAVVTPFYNDNVYYLIVYKIYKDVRFVGAPPSSIGKFGADTDNWMWPRHTGDFSVFRVYSAPDGSPADYSPENVPLRPKNHLKVSLNGIQAGDYTMIMGYPGRTTRFQTSPELKFQIEQNDVRIAARTIRQDVLLEDMLADPKVKIQYASKYSGSSNGWKKWQGMKLAFDKLDIIGRAEQEEADFTEWVNANKKRQKKYGTALQDLEKAIEASKESNLAYTKASETIGKIEIVSLATRAQLTLLRVLKNTNDTTAAIEAAYNAVADLYEDYSAETDRKVAKAMLKHYREIAEPEKFLNNLYYKGHEKVNFATLDINEYVDYIFDNSAFTSAQKLKAALEEVGENIYKDPVIELQSNIRSLVDKSMWEANQFAADLAKARNVYTAGLLEWKKGEPSYPDANFTMRLTYGSVNGYSPRDGITYKHYTTLDGVMEKEDPNNWEFVVPEKLKELWKEKDFGWYALPDGKMPVAFLSNNDITGGNSGSPIMNSRGELIGLAFDGNWESMSSDVMFEPELQRCINVDIRYVLFIIEKFGGAAWLVEEMDIVR